MNTILIVLLGGLPFVCIGIWIGLLIARSTYLPTIRYQRKQISHIQRNTEYAIWNAANLGYRCGMYEAENGR